MRAGGPAREVTCHRAWHHRVVGLGRPARSPSPVTPRSLADHPRGTTPACAAVDEPPRPAFYEAPATLPGANGAVIRSEKMTFLLDPLDVTSLVRNANRVLYRTTNRAGEAIAASGTVLVPNAPWIGVGLAPGHRLRARHPGHGRPVRPVAAVLRGHRVRGRRRSRACCCAATPSRCPTTRASAPSGVHTYMDRVSQGRATLDVVRAAQRLSGTGLSATSPVGLMGYSQGGGAAAAAVELAPTYAPELRLKGAVVGAVPADLDEGGARTSTAASTPRSRSSRCAASSASYDVDLSPYLNATGRATSDRVETRVRLRPARQRVREVVDAELQRSADVDADGSRAVQVDRRRAAHRHHQADGAGAGHPLRARRRDPLLGRQADGAGRGAARAPTSTSPPTSRRSTWAASCRRRPRRCRSSRRGSPGSRRSSNCWLL